MVTSKNEGSGKIRNEKWLVWKDRLAIILVIVILAGLVLLFFLDTIINFQCSAWQFFTFECNRLDAEFKPWK